ncbi:MAG: HAMP domain-containing histidine kinase [Acidimicrobiales bacterium]|nr:HAMP domain-containing histidine kinase [Acidimicrobiales bacterium]
MAADRTRWAAARTVRFRVTALAAVAVALVLGIAAVVLVDVQRRALTSSLDETLTAEAAAQADETAVARRDETTATAGDERASDDPADDAATDDQAPGDTTPDAATDDEAPGDTTPDAATDDEAPGDPAGGGATVPAPPVDDDAVAQIVVGGDVVAVSRAGLAERPLVDVTGDGATVRTVDSVPGGDDSYRVATRPVEGTGDPAAVAIVGAPLDDIAENTGLLATSLAVAVPTVTALLAAVVWRLVGRTLRPVEAIRREVAGITGRDLRRRVPEPPGDDEVARLARTMNAMLERLDDAAERQRRFVGDASHELRTPLARIRSDIEIDLAHPEIADADATERRVLDEALAMQHLVDDLLHLARSDASTTDDHRPGPRRATVAIDELVAGEIDRARPRTEAPIAVGDLARATVVGEADDLRRAVANLLDNAMRHARSRVDVTVTADHVGAADAADTADTADVAEVAVIAVADDGPGVPPDQAERIFERFTRLDGARARTEGGAGLGLAIARAIAEAHGGTLDLDGSYTGGARFVLRVPVATTADGRSSIA